jgi:predicted glycogen debranching enzyme
MLEFNHDILANPTAAASREWLETNGLGGFSSSTITGMNTRRYHGLLTAATKPPVSRVVMLSKLEEVLVIDGRRYELSTNQYPGVVHPRGFEYQTGFRLDPFPVFTFVVDGYQLEKSVFMPEGENTVVVEYQLRSVAGEPGSASVNLEVRPLVAFRDCHSTTHENGAIDPVVRTADDIATIKPYGDLPALHFGHNARVIDPNGYWYRNFIYQIEQERGLDFSEDLYSPFSLTFDVPVGGQATIIASTEQHHAVEANELRRSELQRGRSDARPGADPLLEQLTAAAEQFIVKRAQGQTVIAGYPWFSDWGRDTMIALPGLMLIPGGAAMAKNVLREFARHVDQGMLPNHFPDAGENPEYNTVDATLWFFEAARAWMELTGDDEFVREVLYPVFTEIISWHVRGTRYGIRVDEDGLLTSGEPGVQLTWMDAKVRDHVITPRHGKPVEIQALWYNALRLMARWAGAFGDPSAQAGYAELAERAHASLNRTFWNESSVCLFDVVNGSERDGSIRPNQLFAISLTHPLVTGEKAESILRVVERELLTPRGLRTLAPNDPRYVGIYQGGPARRDAAYHQGTVWPWLMGTYFDAQTKTFGPERGRTIAGEWLEQFREHLCEAGLGQISEIFDGDAPHQPRGCFAQAWSVSELLRVAAGFTANDVRTASTAT